VGDTYAYTYIIATHPPPNNAVWIFASFPHVEPATNGTILDTWCTECSWGAKNTLDVELTILTKHAFTSTDPADNPWYQIFSDAIAELGIEVQPQVLSCIHNTPVRCSIGQCMPAAHNQLAPVCRRFFLSSHVFRTVAVHGDVLLSR
jgi:hypothetical protein